MFLEGKTHWSSNTETQVAGSRDVGRHLNAVGMQVGALVLHDDDGRGRSGVGGFPAFSEMEIGRKETIEKREKPAGPKVSRNWGWLEFQSTCRPVKKCR